jgi:hypothetical protein
MGNSSLSQDPEIRAVVHQLNSHFKTKSTLIYQINLIKQKLNSRNSFAKTKEEKTAQDEILLIPDMICKLRRMSQEKKVIGRKEEVGNLDFSEIFGRKELEICELEEKYLEEREKFEELVVVKGQLEEKVRALTERKQPEYEEIEEIKAKLRDIQSETEGLKEMARELHDKLQFLMDTKAKMLIDRGIKRRNHLKQSLNYQPALNVQSKQISKQELIKTIERTKIEQSIQLAYIQDRKKAIETCDERLGEEEIALNLEISQNNEKIDSLQWEIEEMNRELQVLKRDVQTENSLRFDSPVFFTNESDQGSLGNSFSSLLDGMKDYRLDTEAVAEENEKLRSHIRDIFSIKRAQTVGIRND